MELERLDVNPRILTALRRSRLRSTREVLCVSGPDLRRLTGLSRPDVRWLMAAVAAACRSHPPTPALRLRGTRPTLRLSTGCPVLDRLLRGGLPAGGVTELSGESGAGKTQLGLQLSLSAQYPPEYGGLGAGAAYICTEDPFPIRRLRQLIREQCVLRSDVPPALVRGLNFADDIYVEHAADLDSLRVCLTRRVPLLLARRLVRLVVVDSVAALFRSEFQAADWTERSRRLLGVSEELRRLSDGFDAPVLCINQVSDVAADAGASLGLPPPGASPALGLVWANQVMVRLMMRRTGETARRGDQRAALRRLEVVFAPHLAQDGREVAVWREGVRGLAAEEGASA